MDPIFIYYSNLKFAENKKFTLEFSNEDLFQGIFFLKKQRLLSKLKQYPAIEKIPELANRIIKNGADH